MFRAPAPPGTPGPRFRGRGAPGRPPSRRGRTARRARARGRHAGRSTPARPPPRRGCRCCPQLPDHPQPGEAALFPDLRLEAGGGRYRRSKLEGGRWKIEGRRSSLETPLTASPPAPAAGGGSPCGSGFQPRSSELKTSPIFTPIQPAGRDFVRQISGNIRTRDMVQHPVKQRACGWYRSRFQPRYADAGQPAGSCHFSSLNQVAPGERGHAR